MEPEASLPEWLAALESAASRRDDAGLRALEAAPALLRRRLLEHPDADAQRDPSNALWFEHAFLSAELESFTQDVARLVGAAEDGRPGETSAAAVSVTRSLGRIAAVLEVRALRLPPDSLSTPAGTPAQATGVETGDRERESELEVGAAAAEGGTATPATRARVRAMPKEPNSFGTRSLTADEIDQLLRRNNWGVLALSLDDVPYGVPIIYGWDGSTIYFVTGPGRKAEFMSANPVVTLTVTEVEDGGARWRSVIAHGEAKVLTGVGDRLRALGVLRRQRPGTKRRSAKDAARLARARFVSIEATELSGRAMGW